MILFKDLVILSRKAPRDGLNLSFDNGLNLIEYENNYQFKYLKLKYQSSDSGYFIVNNVEFFPSESKDSNMFYLAINSQVFVLSLTLVAPKKDGKVAIEGLQSELLTLKDMPLNNDEEKTNKINAIIDIILKYPLGYVLVDQNDEINTKNQELISLALEKYRDNATFVIFQRKPTVDKLIVEKQGNAIKSSSDSVNISYKFYLNILKDNLLILLLIALEVAFSVFLLTLAPYYFVINSAVWGVLLLFVFLITFIIDLIYLGSSVSFLDKPKPTNKSKLISITIYSMFFTLLGIAFAYLVFYLFYQNNVIIQKDKYTSSCFIASVIVSIIIFILPLFAKYIRKIGLFILSKFKK